MAAPLCLEEYFLDTQLAEAARGQLLNSTTTTQGSPASSHSKSVEQTGEGRVNADVPKLIE